MIYFTCLHCRAAIKTSDNAAGQFAPCPSCGRKLEVPLPVLGPVKPPVVPPKQVHRALADHQRYSHRQRPPDPRRYGLDKGARNGSPLWLGVGAIIGAAMLLICIGVFSRTISSPKSEDPVTVKEQAWYEGGTLHKAKMSEWRAAPYRDRLATCADFMVVILAKETHGRPPEDIEACKPAAVALERLISEAYETGKVDDKRVNVVAVACVFLAAKHAKRND